MKIKTILESFVQLLRLLTFMPNIFITSPTKKYRYNPSPTTQTSPGQPVPPSSNHPFSQNPSILIIIIMDESLSFDFETGLETSPNQPTPTTHHQQPTDLNTTTNHHHQNNNSNNVVINVNSSSGGRRSYRQTVCRHWLRGLCMKGDGCGFLHQYDKSRMPVCRFFRLYGECREQDCVYKHTNEDVKECHMYKLGFCPNGLDCRYKHVKLPGPPPPVQEVLRKIQQLTSHNYGNSNRFFHNRNANHSQGPNNVNQVSRPTTTDSVTIQPPPLPPPHQQHVTQYQQG